MHSGQCSSLDSEGDGYFDRAHLMQLAQNLAKNKRKPPSKKSAQIHTNEHLLHGYTEVKATSKMNLRIQRGGGEIPNSINENIKVDKLQDDGKLLTENDALSDVVATSLITPIPPVTTAAFSIATMPTSRISLIPTQVYKFLYKTQLFKNSDTAPQSNLLNGKTSPFSSTVDIKDEGKTFKQTQHRMIFKYCYKENQWSPRNPEGKKQYDRDFLLQVKSHPKLSLKLDDIPNFNIAKFERYKACLQNSDKKENKSTSSVVNSGNQASCGKLPLLAYPHDAPTSEELTAASLISITKETTPATSSSVSLFERNTSSVPQSEYEISNAVRLPGDEDIKPLCTSNNDRTPFSKNEGFSKDEDKPFTLKQNMPVLKRCYTKDQLNSPNPEGKKQYSREFLLKLQHHSMSLCKPYDLPNLDTLKEEPFSDASSNAPCTKKKGKQSRIAASFKNSFN